MPTPNVFESDRSISDIPNQKTESGPHRPKSNGIRLKARIGHQKRRGVGCCIVEWFHYVTSVCWGKLDGLSARQASTFSAFQSLSWRVSIVLYRTLSSGTDGSFSLNSSMLTISVDRTWYSCSFVQLSISTSWLLNNPLFIRRVNLLAACIRCIAMYDRNKVTKVSAASN